MAAKARRIIRGKKEDDLSDHGVGYVQSGSSEFTRRSAKGSARREHAAHGRPARAQPKDAREFLARTTKQIMKLSCMVSLEDNRDRRAKLQKDLTLKTALAARLEQEIADEAAPKDWDWETVTDIPNDSDVEWFGRDDR